MKKLSEIDAFAPTRSPLTPQERRQIQQQQQQTEKEQGYQFLVELCEMGEIDAARHWAARHVNWGYEIVNDRVEACRE
jgi:DNA-binding FadR family transcriptional regulator